MEENRPFYYDPHPQKKETEDKDRDIEKSVKQFFIYVLTLVVMFVILGIAYGIFYFVRYQ